MSVVSSAFRRRSVAGSCVGDDSLLGDTQSSAGGGESEKIHVSIRLRPLNEKETLKNEVSDWECISSSTLIFKSSMPDRSMLPSAFKFDRVFGPDSSTKQVYEEVAKEVALSVLSGVNASIFAYGQTSSGKTYTVSGITEHAMADIFDYIHQNKEREFVLKFSALEIYNEAVRDLLSSDPSPLRLLDDPERGTIVDKLIEEDIENWDHLQELLSICEAQRHVGETALNEFSSRSHQIIRLVRMLFSVSYHTTFSTSSNVTNSNLVDLAGSERASQTWSTGTRLKEGSHINRSLLTLGTVIRKLSKGKYGHIPYRESKLTRILHNCLGGNAKTAIICTMSPARCHAEQSRNTLMFASCAKEVSTSAQVNVVMSDKVLVKQLQKEIARLESQVKSSGSLSKANDTAALLKEKDLLIEQMEKEIKELTWQRDLAQSHIDSLLKSVGEDRLFIVEENSVSEASDAVLVRNNVDNEYDHISMPSPVSKREMIETKVTVGNDLQQLDDNIHQPSRLSTSNDHWEEEIPQRDAGKTAEICRDVPCVGTKSSSYNSRKGEEKNLVTKMGIGEATSQSAVEETNELSEVSSYDILKVRLQQLQEIIESVEKSPSPSSSQKGISWTKNKSKKVVVMNIPYELWSKKDGEEDEDSEDDTRQSSATEEARPEKGGNPKEEDEEEEDILEMEYEPKMKDLQLQDSECPETDIQFDDTTSVLDSVAGAKKGRMIKHQKQPTKDIGVVSVAEPLRRIREGRQQRPRDLASETNRSSTQSHANWSHNFERYRRKIIELWAKCNVPLVHRSYFFLLFKGDPSDNVYLEVELRRLCFIKDTAALGNNPIVDSQISTYTSSLKNLNRERMMLAKQLQKKLTRKEREEIYLKWNIDIDTKQRALQLAGKVWTDMRNMRHIKESSILVVKLIGFVEPQYAPKELFGLNFLNPSGSPRSFSWRDNMSTLL
ncbi:Kinesin-like protein KIN-7F [Linum perenne]